MQATLLRAMRKGRACRKEASCCRCGVQSRQTLARIGCQHIAGMRTVSAGLLNRFQLRYTSQGPGSPFRRPTTLLNPLSTGSGNRGSETGSQSSNRVSRAYMFLAARMRIGHIQAKPCSGLSSVGTNVVGFDKLAPFFDFAAQVDSEFPRRAAYSFETLLVQGRRYC